MPRAARASGLLAVALALGARQAPQSPAFRASVDHVAVDVVVTDRHDRPITTLTKDDFEILEQGRVQTIANFDLVSIPAPHRTIDWAAAALSPKVDVATNTPPAPISRAFVMVIDDLHIVESDLIPLRRIVTEFVQSLSPDDEAGIVFTGHSSLSVDLTRDVARLGGVADHLREALGFGEDALGTTSAGGPVIPPLIFENARSADLVLKNVAESLAGSGFARRAIVYVSAGSVAVVAPGAPSPAPSDYLFLRDVYDAARRADTPIYTLDPRGLVQPEQAVRGGIGVIGGIGMPDASGQRRLIASNIRHQQDRLYENAEQTGGRAFVNRNDLPRAVDELIADSDVFYVLGYYPDPFAADGKFHAITVKVKTAGARVRARAGYVASEAADTAATGPARPDAPTPMDRALGAGVSVADVALRAAAAPLVPTPKGMSTVVTVEMTYPPQPAGPTDLTDDTDLRILALDQDAKVKVSTDRTFHVTGLPVGANGTTFAMNDLVDLPAQPLTLRIGVSSRLLGRTGTIQVIVDVPKATDDRLQIGGVALGSTPGPEATQAFDVIRETVPFQPTTSRAFSTGDTIRVWASLLWSGKDDTVDATVSVPDAPAMPRHAATVVGVPSGGEGRWHGTLDLTASMAGLTPGAHGLQIDAHLPSGQTATRLIAFVVR